MSECNYENCKDYTLNEDNNIWMNKFKSKCGKNALNVNCAISRILFDAHSELKDMIAFVMNAMKKITLHIYEWMMALAFARYDLVN